MGLFSIHKEHGVLAPAAMLYVNEVFGIADVHSHLLDNGACNFASSSSQFCDHSQIGAALDPL